MSETALKMRGPVHGTKDARRVAVGSSVGAVIETYDFIGFGTAAALYFGSDFFPSDNPMTGTLAAFATLGVGFAARPLGGIIGGHLGDRVGRKPVLVASLIVMGLATFAIGLLPTYASAGILAPILLVAVRIIQGLAFGAEWGGAILMAYEHAPWRSKGRYTGIVQAGFPLGLLLANLVFLLSVHLGGTLAWRVPFLASIVLVVVGLIIRSKVPESPVFEEVKESGAVVASPIRESIRQDWRNILRGIGLRVAETAGYAVSITYMISYLNSSKLATRTETLTSLCIAAGLGIGATMAWGALTDRVGRRPVYLAVCAFGVLFGIPMFLLVNTGTFIAVLLTLVISYAVCQNALAGSQGGWFPELFDALTPRLRRLPGLPGLGHGLGLHPVRHHAALQPIRLDRPGPVVQLLRPRRTARCRRDQGDVRFDRAPPRRWGLGPDAGAGRPRLPQLAAHLRQAGGERVQPHHLTKQGQPVNTQISTCTRSGAKDAGPAVAASAPGDRVRVVAEFAYRMRHHVLNMGEAQGQGYVGQALGAADMFAAVYANRLRYRADDEHWPERDRFLLSTGHYAIGLYAALCEAGIIAETELETYGSDESRLPMSGMASYTPGMEISGGSLGHGLPVAVGLALGLRHQASTARVYNFLSDGELDEGSTWEAAMGAAHHSLGHLTALVDINALQADGPTAGVLSIEPIQEKWAAFGWYTQRVDGNDVSALVGALDRADAQAELSGRPSVVLCDTKIGRGVPLLENRTKAHFMRIDDHEWQTCREQLSERAPEGHTT